MSIWQALIWKEWHEHKWKAVALFAILISIPAYCAVFDRTVLFGTYGAAIAFYAVIAGIFMAMHTLASENSGKTMTLLQSLPSPMRRVAIVKIIAGILCVTFPVAVTALLFAAWVRFVDPTLPAGWGSPIESLVPVALTVAAKGCLCAISIYLWTAFFGLNCKTEIQVGRNGVLALVIWASMFSLMESQPFIVAFWDVVGPAYVSLISSLNLEEDVHQSLGTTGALLRLAILSTLGVCIVRRFGQPRRARKADTPSLATSATWLGAPRPSPLIAIIWKQVREAAPYCFSTPIVIVILSLIAGFASGYSSERFSATVANFAASFGVFGAFVLAVLLGVGSFAEDMRNPLRSFWRSQPISPSLWFWTKFLIGAAAIAVATMLIMAWAAMHDTVPFARHIIIPIILLIAITYSLAALITCLIRQPVYAGIIAIPLTISIGLLGEPSELVRRFDISLATASHVSVYIHAFALILFVGLGWLSVRFDWGIDA